MQQFIQTNYDGGQSDRDSNYSFNLEQKSYDWSNEKERWQFLSKELGQKQELVHQTLKKIGDLDETMEDRGSEMLSLRKAVKHCQEQGFTIGEKL